MSVSTYDSLYHYPAYYDAVFGTSTGIEADFLCDCFRLFAQRKVRRVFEPATGSGRLLIELARRGFRVSGCDLSAAAAAYGNARLKRKGFPNAIQVFDMSEFTLRPQVDAAFNLISSFQHLPDDEAAASHLRSIADSLAPGGIYVIGLQLLPVRGRRCGSESWSGRKGKLSVRTDLKTTRLDRERRLDVCRMLSTIVDGTSRRKIRENLRFRTYTAAQFKSLLRKVPSLEVAATYDFTYTIAEPIVVDPTTQDAIFVLRKKKA